ncbi:GNAT family N-acetyltransferase [Zhaonella formicivorans]|uniref:GNAT family N-acetyltransferase n=1 Tax=Zhaonella formicivorans TaxID=2528593 RepID=UPI0010DAD3EA|nr:N-acetyltransferase [Zhaonella formicivorans]
MEAGESNQIPGQIMLSKITIENEKQKHILIALAPVAVKPEYQGRCIGSQLIQEGLKACKNKGCITVIVLGHPDYYTISSPAFIDTLF